MTVLLSDNKYEIISRAHHASREARYNDREGKVRSGFSSSSMMMDDGSLRLTSSTRLDHAL